MASKAQKTGVVGPAPDTIKEAEKRAKREARKIAAKTILDFIKENTDLPIIDEIKMFIHAPGQRGRKSSGILDQIKDALVNAGTAGMTEMVMFKTFKVGRAEMAHNIRKLILVENTEDRVWIAFDEKAEKYTVVGTGEDAPDKWAGYIPAKKETL